MKKTISILSGLTLSLTSVMGCINNNASNSISHLQTEPRKTSNIFHSKLAESKKLAGNDEIIDFISTLDSQKLDELVKIINEKQTINIIKNETELLAMLEEMGLFIIKNAKIALSMIVDEIASFAVYKTKTIFIKGLEKAALSVLSKSLDFSKYQLLKLWC